jgi:CPA2 family monovalent cation:H+ antiporter-2
VHQIDLIYTLGAGLISALALGYLTHRLGWSPIVGYLLAGVLVGPHTPGFVANKRLADQLAEVGVILLMFGVGLHFHLKDLLAVRKVAIAGAVMQSAIATALGAFAAHSWGWTWSAGIVFGLALSVASTVVLTRVLSDNGHLHSPAGRIAIGWLVVEDIFTVFVLVLLPMAFGHGATGNIQAALIVVLKLSVFAAFVLVAGGRLIPWLLRKVAETRSRELFTLSVLAAALGIAVGSAEYFGVSMALGAFLAGMVVGQSEFSARAGAEALPLRDAFAVMFFLSVGMLLDPAGALRDPLLWLATLGIVLIGKPLAAIFIVLLLGYGSRVGLGVAISLSQIGEFSFLLASLGRQLKVLPEEAMNAIVVAAIVSIALNPLLYPAAERLDRLLQRRPRLWRLLNRNNVPAAIEPPPAVPAHRAVVVGHGPTGKAVARLLIERGIVPVIIEMNIDTHMKLRAAGFRSVHGDANQREVLEQAGIESAASLIVSTSGADGAAEAIRIARQLNPGIHIISRVEFLSQARALRQAGADDVFSGEGEVALAITDSLLRKLGATPDQLDEERARIRTEFFQHP